MFITRDQARELPHNAGPHAFLEHCRAQRGHERRTNMRTRSKLLLAGMTAALLLATAVSTASANRLSVSNRNFRVVWTALELEAAEAVIRCPVTLEGSFHSATINKTLRALIGHVSRASVNGALAAGACTNGAATIVAASLPWHVQYGGFTGALPRPTGVVLRLINATFRVDPLGILPACNSRTEENEPALGTVNIEANGLVTGLTADRTAEIALEGGLCVFGGAGHFSGTGRVTLLGSSTQNISVTLI